MRDRLRTAALHARVWIVGGAVALLVVGLGLGLVLRASGLPTLLGGHFQSGEAAPQAPASAPEPTLVAAESAQADGTPLPQAAQSATATEEPSPFAGIAAPLPEPPKRTGPVEHTVTEGEVLWQIAEQYSLRPETVLWANDIDNPDLLLIGEKLLIPPSDGVLYTVRPGDALADIANRYGVDLQAIVSANSFTDPNQVQAGTDIFLPGGRPIAAAPTSAADTVEAPPGDDGQTTALAVAPVPLPSNIDDLLAAGWLRTQHATDLLKAPDRGSATLHQLPAGARLERLDGFKGTRIQVRDPGDGKTRQAMTGWVDANALDVGRAPATRELPLAYPADTAMDISHVFAPYRSQLDGSPYAEANCGPTAVGMALNAFGIDVPPRQIRASALDAQHMYGNGVGTLITALAQVVEQNGLSTFGLRNDDGSIHKWSLDEVRAQIQQGHPVIAQVRYRSLPGRGGAYYFGDHYILVTGVVGDGFLYNDPIDVDGLGWDRVISGATLRNAMNASDARYAYSAVGVGH